VTSVPRQLAIFAAVLAVLYAGGYAAGHVIDADAPHGDDQAHAGAATETVEHGEGASAQHGKEAEHVVAGEGTPSEVRGLSSTEDGLRLTVPAVALERGRPQRVQFQVLDEDGAPVTAYDVEHARRMHLILVRRDLTGFQHLHPRLDDAGVWTALTRFPESGAHRLFADFAHEGERTTLAGDVTVEGPATTRALPAPSASATAPGGYEVRLAAADAPAGEHARLEFTVRRGGAVVETQPYLAAAGHLVALREGDLAFLHVHPDEESLAFDATFPTAGRYRLFLQFRHAGRVRTAAFTHEVG
jgi:hypothetical protein